MRIAIGLLGLALLGCQASSSPPTLAYVPESVPIRTTGTAEVIPAPPETAGRPGSVPPPAEKGYGPDETAQENLDPSVTRRSTEIAQSDLAALRIVAASERIAGPY